MDRFFQIEQGGARQKTPHPHIIVNESINAKRGELYEQEKSLASLATADRHDLQFSSASSAIAQEGDETQIYLIPNVFDVETRSVIAATGALILEVGYDYVLVEATDPERKDIERTLKVKL